MILFSLCLVLYYIVNYESRKNIIEYRISEYAIDLGSLCNIV